MTAKEAASIWNISLRSVQSACSKGKIKGAEKLANAWFLPKESDYPKDGRIKSGEYLDWRKKK